MIREALFCQCFSRGFPRKLNFMIGGSTQERREGG
jgi:hypothetical protein